jgi:hypothetical protein
VWLDLRTAGTKIFGAYSTDAGASWSKNVLLYTSPSGTVCECCHPSIAAAGHNSFEVLFRNSLNGDRDMYALRWTAGKPPGTAQKLGTGAWHLNACPMDGGGIAVHGPTIVSAWRRERRVILAQQDQPEVDLGEGKDVALALARAGAFIAWTGFDGTLLLHVPGEQRPRALAKPGAYPALISLPNGNVLAAWEDGNTIQTEVVSKNSGTGPR